LLTGNNKSGKTWVRLPPPPPSTLRGKTSILLARVVKDDNSR